MSWQFFIPLFSPFRKRGTINFAFLAAFLIIECSASGLKYMTLKIKILEYSKMLMERFFSWSQGETEGVNGNMSWQFFIPLFSPFRKRGTIKCVYFRCLVECELTVFLSPSSPPFEKRGRLSACISDVWLKAIWQFFLSPSSPPFEKGGRLISFF